MKSNYLAALVILFGMVACAPAPKPQSATPLTKQQAIDIALQAVRQREKWGDHVDVINVRYTGHKWELMVSGYSLGDHGEHLSPVDAWDRYISIDDQGTLVDYRGTFDL